MAVKIQFMVREPDISSKNKGKPVRTKAPNAVSIGRQNLHWKVETREWQRREHLNRHQTIGTGKMKLIDWSPC